MNQISRWFIILLAIFILLGSSFYYVNALNQKQVILILINQLSFADVEIFNEIPGFERLDKYAAMGLMNINSSGNRNAGNSYLTISGGSRSSGKELGKSYQANEFVDTNNLIRAKDYYIQQTGKKINNGETLIFLPINQLRITKQKFPYSVGILGDTLAKYNLRSRVYGNNDTNEKIRYAPLITMNNQGLSYGDIGDNTLIKDNLRPFGIKTNYQYLLNQGKEALENGVSLVVFDLGDLYRLEQFKNNMSQSYEEKIRKETYLEIGSFINSIIEQLSDNQLLIIASPMVNEEAEKENLLLSPIWIYSNNQSGNLLTSGTTKRDGIVANIDLNPTILSFLGVEEKPNEILGEEIDVINSKIDLGKEREHISAIYNFRPDVLYPYVMWQIIVLLFSIWVWLKKSKSNISVAKIALSGLLYVPILLLVSAFITPEKLYLYLAFMLTISLFLGWATNYLTSTKQFFFVGLLTYMFITIDIFLGGPFIKRSFLGYDPIIGARYYGIGNEYMGIYIGATLLFTSALVQLRKNWITLTITGMVYFLLIFVLLFPTLGTNAGGAISAIFACGLTYLNIIGFRWRKKNIILLLISTTLLIIIIALVNFIVPQENQSHIGRAVNQLQAGNFLAIYQTITRKLSMNWKLIQVSSWSKVIITSIFVIGIFFIKNSFKKLKLKNLNLFYGFYGIVLGAFVSLLVNDSGVVSAATMIIYVAVPMLYLAIKEKELKD